MSYGDESLCGVGGDKFGENSSFLQVRFMDKKKRVQLKTRWKRDMRSHNCVTTSEYSGGKPLRICKITLLSTTN